MNKLTVGENMQLFKKSVVYFIIFSYLQSCVLQAFPPSSHDGPSYDETMDMGVPDAAAPPQRMLDIPQPQGMFDPLWRLFPKITRGDVTDRDRSAGGELTQTLLQSGDDADEDAFGAPMAVFVTDSSGDAAQDDMVPSAPPSDGDAIIEDTAILDELPSNGDFALQPRRKRAKIFRRPQQYINPRIVQLFGDEMGQRLLYMEKGYQPLRWIYIDRFMERIGQYLWLREENIGPRGSRKWMWAWGQGLPLHDYKSFAKARAAHGFRQGFEFGIFFPFKVMLIGFLGYNIIPIIENGFDLQKIVMAYRNKTDNALADSLVVLNILPSSARWGLISLLAFPVLWGLIKAFLHGRNSLQDNPQSFTKALKIIRERPTNRSWWYDSLRWIFPLHCLDRNIHYLSLGLVSRLIPSSPFSDIGNRQAAMDALEQLISDHGHLTRIVGLKALAKIAGGIHTAQFELLHECGISGDMISQLAEEKKQALRIIDKYSKIKITNLSTLQHRAYALYLRWLLGDVDTTTRKGKILYSSVYLFKLIKLFTTYSLLYSFWKQYRSYNQCPFKYSNPDLAKLSNIDYENLVETKCIDSLLKVFNKITTQPASTFNNLHGISFDGFALPNLNYNVNDGDAKITNYQINVVGTNWLEEVWNALIGKRAGASRLWSFSLAKKALTDGQMADIFKILNKIINNSIRKGSLQYLSLDLSGNLLTSAGLKSLLDTIDNPKILIGLSFSNNKIGSAGTADTVALANAIAKFSNLISLSLSNNKIGSTGTLGTVALMDAIAKLPNLIKVDEVFSYDFLEGADSLYDNIDSISIDVSGNNIGLMGTEGIVALAEAIAKLPNFTSINIASNNIGLMGTEGIVALAEAIAKLPNFTSINIASNNIGLMGTEGTMALARAIAGKSKLESIDISSNNIGLMGTEGTVALAHAIAGLSNLESIDISNNSIGLHGTEDTVALADAIIEIL